MQQSFWVEEVTKALDRKEPDNGGPVHIPRMAFDRHVKTVVVLEVEVMLVVSTSCIHGECGVL